MKFIPLVALLLASSIAQATEDFGSAGYIADVCAEYDAPQISSQRGAICAMTIASFLDGLRVGADRGLRTAFIEDQAVLGTTKGIQDVQRRILAIRPKAHCVASNTGAFEVRSVFVRFMARHAERRSERYPAVMIDAIEAGFCSK